jgi:hypothetical protein
MMSKEKYILLASQEIWQPTFAITKQILSVMQIAMVDGKPIVERLENNDNDDTVTIYFKVANEQFFVAVRIEKETEKINFVWVQSACKVYFTASSETHTLQQLKAEFYGNQVAGYSMGDAINNTKNIHRVSRLNYNLQTSMAFDTEELLQDLVDELDNNKTLFMPFRKSHGCAIIICKYQYVSANAGLHLNTSLIKKIANLDLLLDIDTYIVGKPLD